MSSATKVPTLPITKIVRNPDAIRQVKRDDPKVVQMIDSVKARGILQAIMVRPAPDGSDRYVIVDGDHRFTCAEILGFENVPVEIRELTDLEAYKIQYVANVHRVETTPAALGNQLKRIIVRDPSVTAATLATDLGLSISTVLNRLKLADTHPDVQTLVDAGGINLSNALAIAMLPLEEQLGFVENGRVMNSDEFTSLVKERKKELDKAKREGRNPDEPKKEYSPQPHLRTLNDIKDARLSAPLISMIVGTETNPVTAAKMVFDWVLHMDPESIKIALALHEQRKIDSAAKNAAKTAERAAKKQADADKALEASRLKAVESAPAPVA